MRRLHLLLTIFILLVILEKSIIAQPKDSTKLNKFGVQFEVHRSFLTAKSLIGEYRNLNNYIKYGGDIAINWNREKANYVLGSGFYEFENSSFVKEGKIVTFIENQYSAAHLFVGGSQWLLKYEGLKIGLHERVNYYIVNRSIVAKYYTDNTYGPVLGGTGTFRIDWPDKPVYKNYVNLWLGVGLQYEITNDILFNYNLSYAPSKGDMKKNTFGTIGIGFMVY